MTDIQAFYSSFPSLTHDAIDGVFETLRDEMRNRPQDEFEVEMFARLEHLAQERANLIEREAQERKNIIQQREMARAKEIEASRIQQQEAQERARLVDQQAKERAIEQARETARVQAQAYADEQLKAQARQLAESRVRAKSAPFFPNHNSTISLNYSQTSPSNPQQPSSQNSLSFQPLQNFPMSCSPQNFPMSCSPQHFQQPSPVTPQHYPPLTPSTVAARKEALLKQKALLEQTMAANRKKQELFSSLSASKFPGMTPEQQLEEYKKDLNETMQQEIELRKQFIQEQEDQTAALQDQIRDQESQTYRLNEQTKAFCSNTSDVKTSESALMASRVLQDIQQHGTGIDKVHESPCITGCFCVKEQVRKGPALRLTTNSIAQPSYPAFGYPSLPYSVPNYPPYTSPDPNRLWSSSASK